MAGLRRWSAVFTVAVCALAGAATPARAGTFTHYGPPDAGAWSLWGHAVAGGAGTLPNDYPSPQPWSLPAGDYCTAYKFAQPSAPRTSAPFATASGFDLAGRTGFDPGVPREPYQLRHTPQADSSACQAKGATWGFWTNANTNDNYCSNWCGVRHDYATGQAAGTRPWSNGYPAGARLVMSAFRSVRTYAANLGWSFICAMLQDTTTSQRLEYCLRVWRSWSGAAADAPTVFYDPPIGTGFTSVVTDITMAGTRYAENRGGAPTVLGTQPSGATYSGAIGRTHLVNAVTDANARIRAGNLGSCLGLVTRVRCYSTDPDKYALFGVEDGLEILGGGMSSMGGHSRGLLVYTEY
jgi:hypothetical protein